MPEHCHKVYKAMVFANGTIPDCFASACSMPTQSSEGAEKYNLIRSSFISGSVMVRLLFSERGKSVSGKFQTYSKA